MIEYLYDAVRATAGENITLAAKITDDSGAVITENCHIMLFDDLSLLGMFEGVLDGEEWSFTIPAEVTSGLIGRYWYCICAEYGSLCFKQPLYLI